MTMNSVDVNQEFKGGASEKKIKFQCPICHAPKKLAVPVKIVDQSANITTVSIPSGLICEHSFQAYIDKNFKVRGYQKIDFCLTKVEYFDDMGSSGIDTSNQGGGVQTPPEIMDISKFQDVLAILREFVEEHSKTEEVVGASLLTPEGRVIYSSLPIDILTSTIKEFEVRTQKNLIQVKKLFLLLENDQVISSEVVTIREKKFVIALIFSPDVKFGLSNFYLSDLVQKVGEA